MRISDWSSDVCSSDLLPGGLLRRTLGGLLGDLAGGRLANCLLRGLADRFLRRLLGGTFLRSFLRGHEMALLVSGTIGCSSPVQNIAAGIGPVTNRRRARRVGTDSDRSEGNTSELPSLMRTSHAAFCL